MWQIILFNLTSIILTIRKQKYQRVNDMLPEEKSKSKNRQTTYGFWLEYCLTR